LYNNNVTWGYYVTEGAEPDCEDDEAECDPVAQGPGTPGIWNPLPYFDTVKQDDQLENIQDVSNFYDTAKNGTLPAVSWVVPSKKESEHAQRVSMMDKPSSLASSTPSCRGPTGTARPSF
jgi:phospholipase C